MYQNFSLYMLANHDQNCKVEFIQLCVGFISCQIFFIIQQLDTLYLGVNNVRVVCESMKKFKCVCIGGFSRQDSHDWISRVTQDWQLAKMPHV